MCARGDVEMCGAAQALAQASGNGARLPAGSADLAVHGVVSDADARGAAPQARLQMALGLYASAVRVRVDERGMREEGLRGVLEVLRGLKGGLARWPRMGAVLLLTIARTATALHLNVRAREPGKCAVKNQNQRRI